jgi:hypothetical protein
MKNVNPIHIVALLLVMLMFFILKTGTAKDQFSQMQNEYKQRVSISKELKGLEKAYGDKTYVRNIVKNFNIKKDFNKKSVVLSAQSIDKRELDQIMNKVLNSSCNINSFDIKKLSDEKVSFEMEIKW